MRGSSLRRVAGVVAVLASVPFVVLLVGRLLGLDQGSVRWFQLEAFFHESVFLLVVAVVGCALARDRRLWVFVGVLVVAAGIVMWPNRMWASPQPDARGPTIRVVSANIYAYNDSLDRAIEDLAALEPDVLLLHEMSEDVRPIVESSMLVEDLPHTFGPQGERGQTTVVMSRYPLEDRRTIASRSRRFPVVGVHVDGVGLTVVGVHASPPVGGLSPLSDQLDRLGAEVASMDGEQVVLAGDFNSSHEHGPFRDLLGRELRDAHLETGQGLANSWRNHGGFLPAIVLIDRVLVTAEIAVDDVHTRNIAGSDHRAVVADLHLPR